MNKPRSSSELKALAREQLLGKYAMAIGMYCIVFSISFVISIISSFAIDTSTTYGFFVNYAVSVIISLIFSVFSVGFCFFYLNICKNRFYSINDLFYGFKNHPDKAILASLFILIVSVLSAIPFGICLRLYIVGSDLIFIPLIAVCAIIYIVLSTYISLTYSMVFYIIAEKKDYTCKEALSMSRTIMSGHRLQLLYLNISFIGWIILGMLSMGFAFFWIIPYMVATQTYFYLDLTESASSDISADAASNPYSHLYL